MNAAGQRKFGVTINGHRIDDVDPIADAGGKYKPLVRTIPDVSLDVRGRILVQFQERYGGQSPAINGVEMVRQ